MNWLEGIEDLIIGVALIVAGYELLDDEKMEFRQRVLWFAYENLSFNFA